MAHCISDGNRLALVSEHLVVAVAQTGMKLEDFGLELGPSNPDFVQLAESYGAKGYRIGSQTEFSAVMQQCLSSRGVHVVEVPIDYSSSSHLQVQLRQAASCGHLMILHLNLA